MKSHPAWSYDHYQMPFCEKEIYLCRVVPNQTGILLEWETSSPGPFAVWGKEKDAEGFTLWGKSYDCRFLAENLPEGRDFQFYVASETGESDLRCARTAPAIGSVVNYLHPEDSVYAFSGQYLCSPSLVRLPDGALLAGMDVYQGISPQNLSLIFRSEDEGATWHHLCDLFPCFWPRLFLHKGVLYVLACSTEYGDLLIGASYDGGKTFTPPTVLLRGSNGKNKNPGVHKNPQPVVLHKGRLYNTLEWGSWGAGYHAAMVMSADENADLLNPESWSFSDPVKYDPTWRGTGFGPSNGAIEGCLAEGKDGRLYNVMRFDMTKKEPCYGFALRFAVDEEDPEAPLQFDRAIPFEANHSKFEIKYDPTSQKYYSVATRISCAEDSKKRTLLSLMVSDDMVNWRVERDLFDSRKEDPEGRKIGYQYVDFLMEGNDILFLCRTAINGADSFHNSNYITFHRIKK